MCTRSNIMYNNLIYYIISVWLRSIFAFYKTQILDGNYIKNSKYLWF